MRFRCEFWHLLQVPGAGAGTAEDPQIPGGTGAVSLHPAVCVLLAMAMAHGPIPGGSQELGLVKAPCVGGEESRAVFGEAPLARCSKAEVQRKNESSWDCAAEKWALTSSLSGL